MVNYILEDRKCDDHTACAKAPADVLSIAKSMGFVPFAVNAYVPRNCSLMARAVGFIGWIVEVVLRTRKLKRGDCLVVQGYPNLLCRRAGWAWLRHLKQKGVRMVWLVHDIEELRYETCETMSESGVVLLMQWSAHVIAHNARMKEWLLQQYAEVPISTLEIFDYLSSGPIRENHGFVSPHRIMIAGNMSPVKSRYLAKLNEVKGVVWHLWGPYFDSEAISGENIVYRGCSSSDELVQELDGDFGLVWDGTSITTCDGPTGNYLRWNNPHKLSLYLSCGVPVVIWSQAAEADYVLKEGVGIVIDSLFELPKALQNVSSEEYSAMRDKAAKVSRLLRIGHYTKQALSPFLSTSPMSNLISRA